MLPPDLIFVETIVDQDGNIRDSTQPDAVKNVVGADYFVAQRHSESFFISGPMRSSRGRWTLPLVVVLDTELIGPRRESFIRVHEWLYM